MKKLVKYSLTHREQVLNLFDSNVPEFFDPSERDPFVDFLKNKLESYYICLLNNEIVGAGGYWAENDHEARICWLMVHNTYHNNGIGRYMMNHFHEMIKKEKGYDLNGHRVVNEYNWLFT